MKVDFNREGSKEQMFFNIAVGECFVVDLDTPDQTICMKTFEGDSASNAVDLQSGETLYFGDGERVIPLKAELKVRLDG